MAIRHAPKQREAGVAGRFGVVAERAVLGGDPARLWPRLWRQGNFAGAWSAAMNAILSVAMMGLLVTGVWLWLRRRLRRRERRAAHA